MDLREWEWIIANLTKRWLQLQLVFQMWPYGLSKLTHSGIAVQILYSYGSSKCLFLHPAHEAHQKQFTLSLHLLTSGIYQSLHVFVMV
jgi:hypothetical protein